MKVTDSGLILPEIENRIFTLRGVSVMLDRDLADFYQVPTKRINEQVKRNLSRFPENFCFRLSREELNQLVAICDRFQMLKHSSALPHAFSEQGVAMLSAVINSKVAIQTSICIMNAFVHMRKMRKQNNDLNLRINTLEYRQNKTDLKFEKVFNALEARADAPKQGIFFEGQIFDAWLFVTDLIQSAEKTIELWDHYVDTSVLMLLSKRRPDACARIYMKKVSTVLQTDIEKHNHQYLPIEIIISDTAHDRFLLIDNKRLYHVGASLKDLGKRCFAFSLMGEKVIDEFRKNILSN